ncbi:VOC family protein [Brachybacterium sp. p3-SID957]|uniref:VOC family protein n=1 Tax=Brachybacterium sp. p3-SID957 TaxID=2916049 RepID=UPI00223A96AC|nr:VOC family protein [Brachybacterium sp. p3-SID957]MCT1776694.1 VOC family protein [Brachybacterium sp. p3-SID957]
MNSPTFAIRMVTIDCHDPNALAEFWSAATGSPVLADYGDFVMVDTEPTLGFQRVSHPTPGKNRIHLDGGGADREELVNRLRQLGATEQETRTVPGLTWTVMHDPEGNSFCVGNPTTVDR